jgi:cation diffusion facilitator family transporter
MAIAPSRFHRADAIFRLSMETPANRSAAQKAARQGTLAAAATALALILLKLTVGVLTGTVVVIASAVDSLLDFVVSSFNVYAVRSAERPSDPAYNYGRGKIEGVAAFSEGLFIMASALYILREAVVKFMVPGGHGLEWRLPPAIPAPSLDWAMGAMALSLAVTAALIVFLKRKAKETPSLVLRADTVHYQTDLLSNGGILVTLILVRLSGWAWLDPAIALGVAFYVARAAVPLIRKGLAMLLDHALEPQLVEAIRAIAETTSKRVTGVHELRTRRSGDTNLVEFHLVFDEDISLGEAHRIGDEIEARVRALADTRWMVNIHLDPVDDSHRDRKMSRKGRED